MDNNFQCDVFKSGYLDESGDDGKLGSKWFVMTYISTDDGKKIAKILRRTKEQLRRTKKGEKWLNRLGGEIKFSSFPDKHLRMKLLENLSRLDLEVRFVAISKEGKIIPESEKPRILFNLLSESFINHTKMPSKIIADKDYFRNKKICYLAVKNYEEKKYGDGGLDTAFEVFLLDDEKEKDNCDFVINIRHENSKNHPELQVADLISGAIFQELENGDKTYTDILRKNFKLNGTIKKLKEN